MKKNLLLTTALVAFAMPSWAENYNGDGSTNVNIVDKEYNYIYGSSTNPNIDGDFSLTVNETQTQSDVIGAYFKTPSQDASVEGDVILNIISSNIGLTVTGSQLQDPHGEGNVGVAGKTIVNVKNSTIGESVRGANISGSTDLIGDYSIGNIQLNVENSTVVNEIVSVGSGVSAGDIEINIKGSSSIGTSGDGWLIAGTSRNVGNSVKNTTINLNTDGAENTINVGGYVTSGSRYKDGGVGSVTGNAQLNILGGGTVNVGALNGGITVNGDSVSGTSSLDIKGTTVNVTADENFENADGSIKGFDTITMDDKSSLTAKSLILSEDAIVSVALTNNDTHSKIIVDTLDANGATVKMTVAGEGEYDLVKVNAANINSDFAYNLENGLYTLVEDNGTITATQKSSSEVADSLGLSSDEASALTAATSSAGSSGNASFDEVVSQLNQAAQAGDSSVAKEASKLGADANPIVVSQEASSHDVLFSVVSNELNGAGGAIAEGKSSGDFFKKATAWVRGLFNKADHESTSKSAGFNSDTYGVAFGIDKELDNNVRAGFGYANSQTDIESVGRDTDVDTNSLFVYAKYKPADWYVNTMLAYSWSEYDEKKSILGVNAGAKYDIDTIALQSMYGYETKFKSYDLTPEFGFRYLHIDQDSYTDKLGSKVASNQEDVLTLVAGAKIAKDYTLDNGTILRPELKAALTYDLFDADNSANVLLANGAGYTVDGEKLDRLGFELGAKVSTFATEKTELSAGYLTRFREDYQDHTLTFDVKYNF